MSEAPEAPTRAGRAPLWAGAAVLATLPGCVLSLSGAHPAPPLAAAVYGVAIIGAAFLLSWGAEAAQVDISAGLAIAVLALIAVLPEYAVDFVFTINGGQDYARYGEACVAPDAPPGTESNCSLALANMTGANRILVGIGWSLVVLLAAWRLRRFHRNSQRMSDRTEGEFAGSGATTTVKLERSDAVPLAYLSVACVYALTLPLKDSITLIDGAILVSIFVAYVIRVAKAPAQEPHLVGPAKWIGGMTRRARRTAVLVVFVFSATVILLVAEHFAEALVETGTELGISQFFLVQWLAPLASEAPELLIAGLYAWRLNTTDALATLVSSKVNQWSLLVGTLPVVFALSAGTLDGLPVDAAQREELLLTAAQSIFAVALLVGLQITVRGALSLLGLFVAQFALEATVPDALADFTLIGLSAVYLALAAVLLVRGRHQLRALFRDGFRVSYDELEEEPAGAVR